MSNAALEESEIAAQTDFINNIIISDGKAQQGIENPIISKTLKSIYAETDEIYKYEIDARLPELKYEYALPSFEGIFACRAKSI